MKLISIVSLLAAASMAVAQGTTTTTTTVATPKVNAKKKTAKIKVIPASQMTEEQKEEKAEQALSTSVENPANSGPAAGTSTTSTADAAKAAKKVTVSFVDVMEMTQTAAATNGGIQGPIEHSIAGTVNYKFNDKFNAGLRQYVEYTSQSGSDNQAYLSHTLLMAGTKVGGIFGSNEIAPSVSYYLPTTAAVDSFSRAYGADLGSYNGILRADVEVSWTLNSLMTLAYYANPRQSFIPTQTLANGAVAESTSRYLQYLTLNFTVNDIVTPYAYIADDFRIATERGTALKDELLLGVGTSVALLGGKVSLTPEIYSKNTMKSNGQIADVRYLSHETLNYYLAASMKF